MNHAEQNIDMVVLNTENGSIIPQEIIENDNTNNNQSAVSFKEALKKMSRSGSTIFIIVLSGSLHAFISGTFLARISDEAKEATSIINAEKLGMLSLFAAPITIMSSTISQNLAMKNNGEKTADEIARIVQAGYILAASYSIFPIIIFACTKPILLGMFDKADTLQVANICQDFFWGFLPGVIPYFLRLNTNHFINGLDKRYKVAAIEIGAITLSLGLTYLLILGKHGAMKLEAFGYGLAQSIENFMSLIGYQLMVFFYKDFKEYQLYKPRWNYKGHIINLLKNGLPIILAYFGEQVVLLTFSLAATKMGSNQLIAQNVLTLCVNLLMSASFAFLNAAMVFFGEIYGSKRELDQIKLIKRYIAAGLLISLILPLIALIAFSLIPKLIMQPFVDSADKENAEIVELLTTALPLMAISNAFDSMRLVLAGALIGMGDSKIPALANCLLQALLGAPLMLALGLGTSLGVIGTIAGYGISSLVIGVFCLYRLNIRSNQLAQEVIERNNETIPLGTSSNFFQKAQSPALNKLKADSEKTDQQMPYLTNRQASYNK